MDRRHEIHSAGEIFSLAGTIPAVPGADCPAYVEERVARAFVEAEKARLAGAFTAAAGHYRKTVDRAITPLVAKSERHKMLGTKLGALEKLQRLPEVMLDWIRIVKDDGNYAMHDDDRDFDTAEQVIPARTFTLALLQYLYTLPAEVAAAQEANQVRDSTD